VRDLIGGGLGVGLPQVEGDRLDLGLPLGAELGVEGSQGLGVPALGGPHHRPATVVVGHHGEVAVPLAVGNLVDADPVELIEPPLVEVLGHHPDHGPGHRLPGHPEQPSHRGLVHPLGHERHQVLEIPGEPGSRAGPRDLLGPHSPAPGAAEPADLGLQVELADPSRCRHLRTLRS
jgi:hypothetical protein